MKVRFARDIVPSRCTRAKVLKERSLSPDPTGTGGYSGINKVLGYPLRCHHLHNPIRVNVNSKRTALGPS